MIALPTEIVSEVDLHVKLWSYLSAVGVAVTLRLQQGGRATLIELDRDIAWMKCFSAARVAVAVTFRVAQGGTQTMNAVDRHLGWLNCLSAAGVAVAVFFHYGRVAHKP